MPLRSFEECLQLWVECPCCKCGKLEIELFKAKRHHFNPSGLIPSAMCAPPPACKIEGGYMLRVWLLTLWVHGFRNNYTYQLKNTDSSALPSGSLTQLLFGGCVGEWGPDSWEGACGPPCENWDCRGSRLVDPMGMRMPR